MIKNKYSRLILYLTFGLVVFYPMKGIPSFLLSTIAGSDISDLIIPFFSFLTLAFIALNLLANRLSLSKTDKILLLIGYFAILMAIMRRDNMLLLNTSLLFFLPPILYKFIGIDDRRFFRTIFAFFLISTIIMLMENMTFYPGRFGLPFKPISHEQYFAYGNTLNSASNYEEHIGGDEFDGRLSRGLPIRTGGYLGGSPLIIPVLLSMTATFFYVLMRERWKMLYLFLATVSFYLLVNSISSTAIVAFILTVIFYEIYVQRKTISLLIIALLAATIICLINFNQTGIFIYQRIMANLSSPVYIDRFFGFSLLTPQAILSFLIGRWQWTPPSDISSHVDLVTIILVYGFVAAYLLYRRMLSPLFMLYKSNNLMRKVYSLVVLTVFICFFHAGMTLNINVMLLATLLFLKARDLYLKENKEHQF